MGYYSTVHGEISYTPGLLEDELQDPIIQRYLKYDKDVTLNNDWHTIECSTDDQFKAYCLEEDLKELVAKLVELNPEITFTGYLEVQGEGRGPGNVDLWRLQVKNGKVVEVKPTLVWPEG